MATDLSNKNGLLPRSFRSRVALVVAAISFAALVGWILAASAQSGTQSAPVSDAALSEVTIETAAGPKTWSIELADTPEETARGLMFRKTMEKQHGMLFQFGQTRMVDMWMKNTFIPLDMVFFDANGRISHIHKGAVPQSLDIISSNVPARFVLEVNAGEADTFGLQIGQKASHPWFAKTAQDG